MVSMKPSEKKSNVLNTAVVLPLLEYFKCTVQDPPTIFFLENALKKTIEYYLKFLFLFESTILPVNNGK